MASKLVAVLLMVCLVAAGAVETTKQQQQGNNYVLKPQATSQECYSYCYGACAFPAAFCKWMCGGRCKNPIFFGNNSINARKVQSAKPTKSMEEATHKH